jgi:septation ring formation regulator EzrA
MVAIIGIVIGLIVLMVAIALAVVLMKKRNLSFRKRISNRKTQCKLKSTISYSINRKI